jgi:hypothetical protein
MNKYIFTLTTLVITVILSGCSKKIVNLSDNNFTVANRNMSIDDLSKTIVLDAKEGAGLAILEDIDFGVGTIELDLKGENSPGQSFVGLAFNVQNDMTYEAVYFRPFNFQSKEKIRREHSIQYISVPEYDWRFLRNNYEGQFEAEYLRQPSPDDWFSIKIEIEVGKITVYEKGTNVELLSVSRLNQSKSKRIGLWVGNNSKGEFRNLSFTTRI